MDPPIREGLLAPWHVGGAPAGTLWVIHHAPDRHFDAEDARVLASIAQFAAAAWQTVRALEAVEAGRDEIERRVAERTRALDAANAGLRASEAQARTLVATLPGAAAFVVDHDLRYRLADGEALRESGFTPEAFVGRAVAEVLDPALVGAYTPRLRQALAGVPFEAEHAAHGRVFLSRGVPVRDEAGQVTAALVVSVDVTAQRAAEAALRASEARYRTLVDNVRDYAIFGLDADGVITEWTAGAERVKGYTAAEAVGRHLALFYTPEDVAAGVPARELAEVAARGRGEWEGWRVCKDGTRFWADEIGTAVRDRGADGVPGRLTGFVKISRDLTERRLAEQAAEQAQLQAARDDLRRQLAQAEEAERRRLARELHDQLGQELTAFRLRGRVRDRTYADHSNRLRRAQNMNDLGPFGVRPCPVPKGPAR